MKNLIGSGKPNRILGKGRERGGSSGVQVESHTGVSTQSVQVPTYTTIPSQPQRQNIQSSTAALYASSSPTHHGMQFLEPPNR